MPDLGANDWHYLVVDTKFTTLHLNASGTELANDGSAPAYKAQVYIYNRMLGRLQGFEPPKSYLLGRGWQRRQSSVTYRGSQRDGTIGSGSPGWNCCQRGSPSDTLRKKLSAGYAGFAPRGETGSCCRSRQCPSSIPI